MIYKVKNPFILNNKTFLPGAEVSDDLFFGQESIKVNFLKLGFIVQVTHHQESAIAPEDPAKPFVPQAVEIKSDADLKQTIEKPQESKESVVVPEVVTAPKKSRGKIERN